MELRRSLSVNLDLDSSDFKSNESFFKKDSPEQKSGFGFAERNAKSVLRSKIRFWVHRKEHTLYVTRTPLYGHPPLVTNSFLCSRGKPFPLLDSITWEFKWPQKKLKTMLLQNFGVTNKEHYGYVMAFSIVVNSRYCEKPTRSSFQSTNINFS